MSVKTRLSPQEKLRIFLEGLKDNVKVAEVCRREEIWPNEYYRIKEKALYTGPNNSDIMLRYR